MPFTVTAYIPSVKPGTYQAICTGVEEKSPKNDPTNVFRVWSFQLTDGSHRSVDGSSSLSTSKKSKGGKWITALMGYLPEVGQTVEVEGRPCTIIVALNDDGYERVETVAPPADATPAPVAAPGPSEAVTAGVPSTDDALPF